MVTKTLTERLLTVEKEKEIAMQAQLLLNQKEEVNVALQIQVNHLKQTYDEKVLSFKQIVQHMEKKMINNKLSIQFFRDWTQQLHDKVQAQLKVLYDKNVTLQVENNMLKQRIEPLLALERRELDQDDKEIQGMLMSKSDIEVLKAEMAVIGAQTCQAMKDRLESVIQKPYASLQGAFIPEYEVTLMEQLEVLKDLNFELRQSLQEELVFKQREGELLSKVADKAANTVDKQKEIQVEVPEVEVRQSKVKHSEVGQAEAVQQKQQGSKELEEKQQDAEEQQSVEQPMTVPEEQKKQPGKGVSDILQIDTMQVEEVGGLQP